VEEGDLTFPVSPLDLMVPLQLSPQGDLTGPVTPRKQLLPLEANQEVASDVTAVGAAGVPARQEPSEESKKIYNAREAFHELALAHFHLHLHCKAAESQLEQQQQRTGQHSRTRRRTAGTSRASKPGFWKRFRGIFLVQAAISSSLNLPVLARARE